VDYLTLLNQQYYAQQQEELLRRAYMETAMREQMQQARRGLPVGGVGIGALLSTMGDSFDDLVPSLGFGATAPNMSVNTAASYLPTVPNYTAEPIMSSMPPSSGLAAAAPYLGAAGALYGGATLARNLMDRRKDPKGGAMSGAALGGGLAAAAPLLGFASLGPVGILGAALAGGVLGGGLGLFGNSKNYFDAKARHDSLARITGDKKMPLQFSGGQSLSPQEFAKNSATYNYDQSSPTMERDISVSNPLAYVLTGERDPFAKRLTDLSGAIANLSKQGVGAGELYSKFGVDPNEARRRIQSASDLDNSVRAAYLAGLDRTFGSVPRAPQPPERSMTQAIRGMVSPGAQIVDTGFSKQPPRSLGDVVGKMPFSIATERKNPLFSPRQNSNGRIALY
jgi:hypothetical protein